VITQPDQPSNRLMRRLTARAFHCAAVFAVAWSPLLCPIPAAHAQDSPAAEGARERAEAGDRLLEEGRYQEAAEAFREALMLRDPACCSDELPRDEETRRSLSSWHAEQARRVLREGDPLQALTHAQRARDLSPDDRALHRLEEEAREALDDEKRRMARQQDLIARATEAERRGRTKRALATWRKALELDARNPSIQAAIDRLQSGAGSSPAEVRSEDLIQPSLSEPVTMEYQVSIGDVLEVFVWQQPDLSRDVIVRPDGRISFPLVGDVQASGVTLTKLDEVLTERLRTYVRFPDVSLAIKRFGGVKTVVLGEVVRPGVFVPAGEGRVLDVIAMAGGFTDDAGTEKVVLVRGGLANPQLAKLNLEATLAQGLFQDNVPLQPNDIVFVPKKRLTKVLDFMEQFYPTLQNFLVGQQIATNFGVKDTAPATR